MPPIDVTLHQGSGLDMSSVVIALASFLGVLVASWLTARASGNAAGENAKALLTVEYTRTETEHRRHLRDLVADLAGVARRRSMLTWLSAVVDHQGARADNWTAANQEDLARSVSDLYRAVGLVRLTTDDPDIIKQVNRIVALDKGLRDIYSEHADRGALNNRVLLNAVRDSTDAIDLAADDLVNVAARRITHEA